MSAASDLLPLLALFLLRGSSASSSTPPSGGPVRARPGGGFDVEVTRVRTGGGDPFSSKPNVDLRAWFNERFGLALEVLSGTRGGPVRQANGSPAFPLPDQMIRPVALSLVAQWAHETGRGKSEFNFNLGGWRARKSDPYFVARDVQTGAELFRWTSYPDLPTAVADQIKRLVERFPSAWALLVAQPNTSAWVEELGRRGYYTADRRAYANAWASNRVELERLQG